MKLLSPASSNTKLRKSQGAGYRLVSLSLAPADSSGTGNVCPHATAGCRAVCVGEHTGLATIFPMIMESRKRKTDFFNEQPEQFVAQLRDELRKEQAIAERHGETLIARLNTFSDIVWESKLYHVPQDFPDVVFYDYTKIHGRVGKQPANYVLCASWDEKPEHRKACIDILENGRGTVAVPFANVGKFVSRMAYRQELPRMHRLPGATRAYSVLDGDASDIRSFDRILTPAGFGRIVGLRLKSANNADREQAMKSGFVEIV
jgi:hypothetical protein